MFNEQCSCLDISCSWIITVFLAGFKIKRFFDWCGEQDLPVDDDNNENYEKYHDGNNNDNNYEKYHADKDSKPDIPVDTCYPVYALRMPRLTGLDIHMIMNLSVIMLSFFFKVEQVADS